MYTANTMASAIEAMGLSLPYNSSNPAISIDKSEEKLKISSSIINIIKNDIKPLDNINKINRKCCKINYRFRWINECCSTYSSYL